MKKIFLLFALITLFNPSLKAQTSTQFPTSLISRIPQPVYQFMVFNSFDARPAAMGYGGMALFSDETATYMNPAMLAHSVNKSGLFFMGTPWLSRIVSDMYLLQTGGFYQFKKNGVLSSSFTYFKNGSFQSTDNNGLFDKTINSYDFALGLNYSRRLNTKISMGFGLKYLYGSGMPIMYGIGKEATKNIAFDISLAHLDQDTTQKLNINYGIYIANIGGKVVYNKTESAFLPTNLKIGIAPSFRIDPKNKVSFTVDANKMLIPTPYGNNYNDSAFEGIIHSFSDAPDGLSEELKEITWSLGLQYSYNNFLFLRMGKFIEAKEKGDRGFTTFGAGVIIKKIVSLDLAYSIDKHNANSDVIGNQLFISLGVNILGRR